MQASLRRGSDMTVDAAPRPLGSISARIFVANSGAGGRNGHRSNRGGRSAGGGKETGRDRPAPSMPPTDAGRREPSSAPRPEVNDTDGRRLRADPRPIQLMAQGG